MACPYETNLATAFWSAQGHQTNNQPYRFDSYQIDNFETSDELETYESGTFESRTFEGFEAPQAVRSGTSWGSRSEPVVQTVPEARPSKLESEVAAQVDARTGCTQQLKATCVQNECSTVGDVQTKLRCAACGPCVVPGPATCTKSMIKYCTKAGCATAADMTRGACRGCEPCTVPAPFKNA